MAGRAGQLIVVSGFGGFRVGVVNRNTALGLAVTAAVSIVSIAAVRPSNAPAQIALVLALWVRKFGMLAPGMIYPGHIPAEIYTSKQWSVYFCLKTESRNSKISRAVERAGRLSRASFSSSHNLKLQYAWLQTVAAR